MYFPFRGKGRRGPSILKIFPIKKRGKEDAHGGNFSESVDRNTACGCPTAFG